MSRQTEFAEKLRRIRVFLCEKQYDAALFTRNDSFCWLSCGRYAFVDKSSETAVAVLLVTRDRTLVFCSSIEMYRIPEEELKDLSFTLVDYRWNDDGDRFIREKLKGMRVLSDSGAFGTENRILDLFRLRYVHTAEELARYREIGPFIAAIVEDCIRNVNPGQTECGIAGTVTGSLMAQGCQVPVCLVAADERTLKYRHPLPTSKKLNNIALIGVCVQKYGLTVSLSRMISFKPLSEDIRHKFDAVIRVDAAYIAATVRGARAGDVVKAGKEAYETAGFGQDFYLHHQGGSLGYATRYYCATEHDGNIVMDGQAFSWNPTIAGVKSEDTYLIAGNEQEIISRGGNWPQRIVEIRGKTLERPDILIL
jgi:Xaa-Pro aminopeptidase